MFAPKQNGRYTYSVVQRNLTQLLGVYRKNFDIDRVLMFADEKLEINYQVNRNFNLLIKFMSDQTDNISGLSTLQQSSYLFQLAI